jgi:hypothetical protein
MALLATMLHRTIRPKGIEELQGLISLQQHNG